MFYSAVRLLILTLAIFTTTYSASFSNALVLCLGNDGHTAVELAHNKYYVHYQTASTAGPASDKISPVKMTRSYGNNSQCVDWVTSIGNVSQHNFYIDAYDSDKAEPLTFVPNLPDRGLGVLKENIAWALYKAPPHPYLDELKTVILRR